MNGVQRLVGTHHVQRAIFRHQQNVRNVVAKVLIQVPPLFGKIKGFAAGNVLQINNRVGNSTLLPDDQALEVDGLLPVRIANLRIFRDGIFETSRHRTGPLHGPGNRSTVGYGDDFVIALGHSHRGSG